MAGVFTSRTEKTATTYSLPEGRPEHAPPYPRPFGLVAALCVGQRLLLYAELYSPGPDFSEHHELTLNAAFFQAGNCLTQKIAAKEMKCFDSRLNTLELAALFLLDLRHETGSQKFLDFLQPAPLFVPPRMIKSDDFPPPCTSKN